MIRIMTSLVFDRESSGGRTGVKAEQARRDGRGRVCNRRVVDRTWRHNWQTSLMQVCDSVQHSKN